MSLQIETLPTAELTPYARNARTHSPEHARRFTDKRAQLESTGQPFPEA